MAIFFGVESLWSSGSRSARHPVPPLVQLVRLLLVTIFFFGAGGVCRPGIDSFVC